MEGQERSALAAHRRSKAWQAGLEVLQRRLDGGGAPAAVWNSVLSCQSSWRMCVALLQCMDSDPGTCFVPSQRVFQASVQPTVQSISQSIAAARPEWQAALLLLQRAPLDVVCCNAALAALGRGAQWQRAFEALKQWTQLGLRASTVTFTTLLGACGARWRLALQVLGEMPERKLEAIW